jgi:hypothetical protein
VVVGYNTRTRTPARQSYPTVSYSRLCSLVCYVSVAGVHFFKYEGLTAACPAACRVEWWGLVFTLYVV